MSEPVRYQDPDTGKYVWYNEETGKQVRKPITKKQTLRGADSLDTPGMTYNTPTENEMNVRMKQLQKEGALRAPGEAASARVDMAKETPWLEEMMIKAGDETNALVEGTKRFGNMLGDLVGMDTMQSTLDSIKREESDKKNYKEFDEISSLTSGVGRVLPYMATGIVGDKGFGKLFDMASQSKAAGRGADFGHKIRSKINTDWGNRVLAKSKAPTPDPFLVGARKQAATSTATGTTEGLLHRDESAPTGALSSLTGTVLGRKLGKNFTKNPMAEANPDRKIIDWWKGEGYRVDAGMDTGSPTMQRHVSDIKSGTKLGDRAKVIDDANDQIVLKVALDAVGIPDWKGGPRVSKEVLKGHLETLGKTFDSLENQTVGINDYAKMNHIFEKFTNPKSTFSLSPDDAAAFIRDYDIIKGIPMKQGRTKSGKFTHSSFDGKTYADKRARLITARNKAFGGTEPNKQLGRAYNDLIKEFDAGMERGVGNLKVTNPGKITKQWKDAREQYAMTKLLMDKGLKGNGSINLTGLSSHMNTHEMDRLLTGEGGRIKNLFKIKELGDVKGTQQQSGMARGAIEGSDPQVDPKIIQGNASMSPGLFPRLKADTMLGDNEVWNPAVKGYLGITPWGKGVNANSPLGPAGVARAADAGLDPHMTIAEMLKGGYDDAGAKMKEILKILEGEEEEKDKK